MMKKVSVPVEREFMFSRLNTQQKIMYQFFFATINWDFELNLYLRFSFTTNFVLPSSIANP